MVGLLRISGEIDLKQFWPEGSSDADTTKIKVTVGPDAFRFAASQKQFRTTRAFDDAYARGKSRKKLIDANSRITVRLQGIDAPELHFNAPALPRNRKDVSEAERASFNELNRPERRQYLAESATVALARKLRQYGGEAIPCTVLSFVDHPYEVVDTYGRFVGNIEVGKETDVNVWLAAEGWCYPTFYSSMLNEEIEILLKAAKKAGRKRVWKHYSAKTARFEAKLLYRKPPAEIDAASDEGPILMPKLYRRQVAWKMEKGARIFQGNFRTFLERSPDECFALDDFLKAGPHSAVTTYLHAFLSGTTFKAKPQDIVFKEKFSDVVDAKGKRIEEF
jgi:endonuclease YncB( thermonuclease family)